MGRICSTYGERRSAYRVLVGNLREGDQLKDRGVDGRIILKWIFRWGIDWIYFAQCRDRWPAVMNAVICLWLP